RNVKVMERLVPSRRGAGGPRPRDSDGEKQGVAHDAAGARARVGGAIRPRREALAKPCREGTNEGTRRALRGILHPCVVRVSTGGMAVLPMPGGETREARTNVGSSAERKRSTTPTGRERGNWEEKTSARRIHQESTSAGQSARTPAGVVWSA